MLRWIRSSSRIESFIFLIASGIFFESWELDLQLLLFSYYESSFFLCSFFLESTEDNHFLLAHIPRMNESHDPGRPFTTSYSSLITSNTSFWCLQGWHMRDEMIFNRTCNDSLGSILGLISLWLLDISDWNTAPSQFLQGSRSSYTSSDLYSSLQNSLFKELNISLGVFREDTCGIRWSSWP